ncbi:DP60R [African swine fever virus]
MSLWPPQKKYLR